MTRMGIEDHTVRLDQFEGPLDLLLHLIRKDELDITEIAIAQITDQYLAHVRRLTEHTETIDVESAADFLVTAATLVELKSRTISPDEEAQRRQRESGGRDAGDPAAELIESLLAYQSYRAAADELNDRHAEWSRRYPAAKAAPTKDALREAVRAEAEELDLEDIGLYDLVNAFRSIYETVRMDRLGEHEVEVDDTPIELYQEDIIDRLTRDGAVQQSADALPVGGVRLATLFDGRTRAEMLGLFLALLELVRMRRVGFSVPEEAVGSAARTDALTIWRRADGHEADSDEETAEV